MIDHMNVAESLPSEKRGLEPVKRFCSLGADQRPSVFVAQPISRRESFVLRGRRVALGQMAALGMKLGRRAALFSLALLLSSAGFLNAGVPLVLHFQGHIALADDAVDGTGAFKFALIDSDGVASWSNSVIPAGETEPSLSVDVGVDHGFYSIRLGDTSLPNMDPLSLIHFQVEDLKLRIWFDDGTTGFERLSPDQQIAASAFAVSSHHAEQADVANDVPDGLIEQRHLSQVLANQIQQLDAKVEAFQELVDSIGGGFSSLAAVSTDSSDPILVNAGFERFSTFSETAWQSAPIIGAPLPRYLHSSVWTGSEVLVWGGNLLGGVQGDGGGSYQLESNQWRPLSPVDAPVDRRRHSGVWTGSEMIVWGGFGFPGYLGNGGRYNPISSQWSPVSQVDAPSERADHGVVWSGSHMIIWGGLNGDGAIGDGGFYDPTSDTWAALPLLNAPEPRFEHTVIWAGDRLIVWGGRDALGNPMQTGAQLPFENGIPTAWQSITTNGAPVARSQHGAVWTGVGMVVWGGIGAGLLGDGGVYDPASDSWASVSTVGAPTPRSLHSLVWTGTEVLVHGGNTSQGASASSYAFDPSADQWRALTLSGSPVARSEASTVWTGEELVAFGGRQNGSLLAVLQRLNPRPSVHLYRIP